MEKIIDTAALIDSLRILLWDRSKTREELAELVIGLIEKAGEEIVRCKDCVNYENFIMQDIFIMYGKRKNGYCWAGTQRRDSDG